MATKRKYNAGKQQSGPDSESPFVNLPWGAAQDESFDKWLDEGGTDNLAVLFDGFLGDDLTIKVGQQGESFYCTLDSKEAREVGTKHLLSGWSDTLLECVQICAFKWESLLGKNFEHPTVTQAKSRRR
jgi:hypothetical protein